MQNCCRIFCKYGLLNDSKNFHAIKETFSHASFAEISIPKPQTPNLESIPELMKFAVSRSLSRTRTGSWRSPVVQHPIRSRSPARLPPHAARAAVPSRSVRRTQEIFVG